MTPEAGRRAASWRPAVSSVELSGIDPEDAPGDVGEPERSHPVGQSNGRLRAQASYSIGDRMNPLQTEAAEEECARGNGDGVQAIPTIERVDVQRRHHPIGLGVDPGEGAVSLIADPDCPEAGRNRQGHRSDLADSHALDRDGGDDLVVSRVDPDDSPRPAIRDPDGPLANRDPGWSLTRLTDHADHPTGRGVGANDSIGLVARHPERPVGDYQVQGSYTQRD